MDENNVTLFLNPYHLEITDAANELIQDSYGTIAEVNKSLLTDNHIQSQDGTISVSRSLYNQWFAGLYKRPELMKALLQKKFVKNIDLILGSKAVIYNDSRIFMAELPFSYLDGTMWGINYLSLGVLMKAWETNSLDFQCPYCQNMLKLLNIGGFSLSGTHIAQGYCFNCRRIIQLKTESFSKYTNNFYEANNLYRNPDAPADAFTFEDAIAIFKYLNKH